MVKLFETMVGFLVEDDWPVTPIGEEYAVSMTFAGENGEWPCIAQVDETLGRMLFYSASPGDVPADRRPAMAEFVTRANYGMLIGNFELDLDDGDLRFKTSLDVRDVDGLDQPALAQLIRLIVYTNVLTMDRYLPGARAVADEGVDAAAAIAAIEG